jgi:phosphatidylglycerol:prolipoprotein diacylglycerol transferase
MFLIGYGVFRSFAEFFREPEEGFMGIMTLGISMGQWLSLPMIVAGVLMLNRAYRKQHMPSPQELPRPGKPGRPLAPGKRHRK